MDKIHIRDLRLRCIIGAYPEERHEKQDVVINLVLFNDQQAASRSDRLEDAVDYKQLKLRLVKFVEQSQYMLIESLAEHIARLCLQTPGIQQVNVTVDKPGALRFARSVAVEITRP